MYQTRRTGLRPGHTQTITIAARNINASFIVTSIRTMIDGDLLLREVTATERTSLAPDWINQYQSWFGGPSNTVTSVQTPGGGGSGRSVYWFGGSDTSAVQSPTPDWVPAAARSAVQVTIDTVVRGTTAGTMIVRIRADSGTVTARLRNVSDGVTVGTSSAVASASFQTVSFNVTLTTGSRIYQLELLPSVANVDVALGSAFLE